MSRLFSTAISSMQTHSLGIDVAGNNIANLNTTGYKSVRATFETLFSQTLRQAQAPQSGLAGNDPMQVGAGVGLANTMTSFARGSLEHTGENLDLAIAGRGFFVLAGPNGEEAYTRDGALTMDAGGRLTHASSGLSVQGLLADPATNQIPANALPTDIVIPPGLTLNAQATENVNIAGNLNASAAVGDSTDMQYRYYDSLGVAHVMTVSFTKTGAGAWGFSGYIDVPANNVGSGTLTFSSTGDVSAVTGNTFNVTAASTGVTSGATAPQAILANLTQMTQFSSTAEVQATNQDGFPPGSLNDVITDTTGNIQAVFSNGQTRLIARLAVANFANLNGLVRSGDNLFIQSSNTGSPQIVSAGSGGTGQIQSQALERSNVDLASELTTLLVLQRGYSAATRMVSTADDMLQEALNLKR